MRIVCISDLHGQLPEIPECDLLLIAGDICMGMGYASNNECLFYQAKWLREGFKDWLESLNLKPEQIVGTWGNHDFIGEKLDRIPKLPMTLLIDKQHEYNGLKIWLSPWQLPYFDWAFNAPEAVLEKKYSQIPTDTNIIVTHGPPQNYGDLVKTKKTHKAGSLALEKWVLENNPGLVVTGHIHSAYGTYEMPNGTKVANAALVDMSYKIKNKPIVYDYLDGEFKIAGSRS